MIRLVSTKAKLCRKRRKISTILVVEDEVNIRKLVTMNLRSRGYQIVEAANGEDALEQLRSQTPEMMVLDIKLPDLTGWEILNIMVKDPTLPAGFPVLVMTASLGDANVDLKRYPCVIEILIKPFKTEKLVAMVQRTLGTKRM